MLILKLLVLLMLANGTPVIAKKILGKRFAFPVDAGVRFVDGKPLFGTSKTIRGLVLSVLVTAVGAELLGFAWQTGALFASMSMLGDLFSSFIKRRMGKPASSMAMGLDQVPESLFPLLACQHALGVSIVDLVVVVVIFSVGGLLLSRLLYKWHIRDHPY